MSGQLYRRIDVDDIEKISDSPISVQFVGVRTLRWGRDKDPSVGFWEAEETIYTEKLREYLDDAIEHWRSIRDHNSIKCDMYIDAFQSVRTSMLGETLPE